MIGYDFQSELAGLRLRLGQNMISQPADFRGEVQPLVIRMDAALRRRHGNLSKDDSHDLRAAMLSYVLLQNIGSTYDLSAYQCRTLNGWLSASEERAGFFLEDLEDAAQGRSVQPKSYAPTTSTLRRPRLASS